MKLPTEQQCLNWFKEFKVPNNIFKHCLKVREVALNLGKQFQDKNHIIDLDLLDRMALLHDMFKMVSVNLNAHTKYHNYTFSEEELLARDDLIKKYPGMHEGEVAHSFLLDKYPDLAVALQRSTSLTERKEGWEEILVHYADWRTLQNQVVTIPERIIYLEQTYHPEGKTWEEHKEQILEYENKIVKVLSVSPENMLIGVNS